MESWAAIGRRAQRAPQTGDRGPLRARDPPVVCPTQLGARRVGGVGDQRRQHRQIDRRVPAPTLGRRHDGSGDAPPGHPPLDRAVGPRRVPGLTRRWSGSRDPVERQRPEQRIVDVSVGSPYVEGVSCGLCCHHQRPLASRRVLRPSPLVEPRSISEGTRFWGQQWGQLLSCDHSILFESTTYAVDVIDRTATMPRVKTTPLSRRSNLTCRCFFGRA